MKSNNVTAVFLHGWSLHSGVWFGQEEFFVGDRAIRNNYDKYESYGETENVEDLFTKNVLKAIENKSDKVVLIGWSLGSLVALKLVSIIPEKIAGLVFIGGTARFTKAPNYDAGLPKVLVERMKKRLTVNVDRTVKEFYSLMFSPEERSAGIVDLFERKVLSEDLSWSRNELIAGLEFLLSQDLRGELGTIKVPALIIHGEKDEICPQTSGYFLHNNIKNSRLHIMSGCGHMPFLSKKVEFNNIVRWWLGEISE